MNIDSPFHRMRKGVYKLLYSKERRFVNRAGDPVVICDSALIVSRYQVCIGHPYRVGFYTVVDCCDTRRGLYHRGLPVAISYFSAAPPRETKTVRDVLLFLDAPVLDLPQSTPLEQLPGFYLSCAWMTGEELSRSFNMCYDVTEEVDT